MKLLIFAKQYLPEISAQSVRVSQMVRRFGQIDEDLEVRIIAFDPEGMRMAESEGSEGTIEVKRYFRILLPAFALKPQSLNPLLLAFWTCIALKEIAAFNPSVVMSSTPPFTPTIALYVASKISRRKFAYIVDYRDDLTSVIDGLANQMKYYIKYPLKAANKLMSSLLLKSIKNASIVCTVNESLQNKLKKENKRVLLVPNGIDLQELDSIRRQFDRKEILEKNGLFDMNSKIVVFLGDLDMPYYMPETIFEPLRMLRKKGKHINFMIIGDGARRSLIDAQIKKLGLEDSVYMMGRKPHRESMELLMASDIAFYPLQKDYPQSKHVIAAKVYEYVGCKLPILALADEDSAISEFLAINGIGISLNWDELDKIEAALNRLLESSEYRSNLEENYSRLIEKFDRNKGVDLLYRCLKDALKEYSFE